MHNVLIFDSTPPTNNHLNNDINLFVQKGNNLKVLNKSAGRSFPFIENTYSNPFRYIITLFDGCMVAYYGWGLYQHCIHTVSIFEHIWAPIR